MTHLVIALSTYISQYLGRSASILECCNQDDLIQMGVRCAASGSVKEDRFEINHVRYFINIKEKEFAKIFLECGEYIVLDLGNCYEKAKPYLLLSTHTILVGNLSPWKISSFMRFIIQIREKEINVMWSTVCATFGIEKEKKEMKKKINISPVLLPFIENPLCITQEHCKIFAKILMV